MTSDRRDSDLRELVVGPQRVLRPGLDFHGVVANTQLYRQKLLWQNHGIWIQDPVLIRRSILVKKLRSVSNGVFTELMHALYVDPKEFSTYVSFYPGALETISYHLQNGDQTSIVTASDENALRCCIQWCNDRGLDSSVLRVLSCGRKGSKVEIARECGLTSQLDDGLKNLFQIRKACGVSTRPIFMFRLSEQPIRQKKWSGITVVNTFTQYRQVMEEMRRAP